VIDSMKFKIEKQLNCTKEHSGEVLIESFYNFYEELDFITYEIKQLINSGVKKDEIAVLFRTNRIGKEIERELKKNKIPRHLSRSKNFFEREEIKDVISFLKLKLNGRSIIDFERIFSLMDGLGKASMKKFESLSFEKRCSLVEALGHFKELKLSQDKALQVMKLKNKSDVPAAKQGAFVLTEGMQVCSADAHFTAVGHIYATHQVEQGTFPGSRTAQQHNHFL
jgi:superfamily I DNA/RNA helicase